MNCDWCYLSAAACHGGATLRCLALFTRRWGDDCLAAAYQGLSHHTPNIQTSLPCQTLLCYDFICVVFRVPSLLNEAANTNWDYTWAAEKENDSVALNARLQVKSDAIKLRSERVSSPGVQCRHVLAEAMSRVYSAKNSMTSINVYGLCCIFACVVVLCDHV